MDRDEQRAITEFVECAVSGDLPPMDIEADAIIRALFVRNPDAAYRMTRLAMALSCGAHKNGDVTPAAALRRGWLGLVLGRSGEPELRAESKISKQHS